MSAIIVSADTVKRLHASKMPPVSSNLGTWKCNAYPDRYIVWPYGIELRHADCTQLIRRGVIGPAVAADAAMAKKFDEQNIVGIWIKDDKISELTARSEN